MTTIMTTKIMVIGTRILNKPKRSGPQKGKVISKNTMAANSKMKAKISIFNWFNQIWINTAQFSLKNKLTMSQTYLI